MANHPNITTLTSQFPTVSAPTQGVAELGSPISHANNLTHEDLAVIGQIAADLLEDPIALQQLCDYVYTLLQQDLAHQRAR